MPLVFYPQCGQSVIQLSNTPILSRWNKQLSFKDWYVFHSCSFLRGCSFLFCVHPLHVLSTHSDCFRAFVVSSFFGLLSKQKGKYCQYVSKKFKTVWWQNLQLLETKKIGSTCVFAQALQASARPLALSFMRANHYNWTRSQRDSHWHQSNYIVQV